MAPISVTPKLVQTRCLDIHTSWADVEEFVDQYKIQVPTFHRGVVWTPDQQREVATLHNMGLARPCVLHLGRSQHFRENRDSPHYVLDGLNTFHALRKHGARGKGLTNAFQVVVHVGTMDDFRVLTQILNRPSPAGWSGVIGSKPC